MQISIVLLILCEISRNSLPVSCGVANAGFLWSVVNSSLTEKKAPKHCAKVVFFNNQMLGDPVIAESQRGIVANSFINIDEFILNEDYRQWVTAEEKLREATEKSIAEKLDPCVTVISFVLNATQYNLSPKTKSSIRYHMVDLLQFATPVSCRHLVLLRVSRNLDDFRFCTKSTKYPIRLVPDWEMILFDFFTDVRVIQGMFYENGDERNPYVRINRENGRWRWLCEDIIYNLEIERSCNYNLDQKCLEANPELKIWKPGQRAEGKTCKRGFRPRQ